MLDVRLGAGVGHRGRSGIGGPGAGVVRLYTLAVKLLCLYLQQL